MKHYSVITGFSEVPDNLHPDKIHKYPQEKGNISIIAISRAVASLCVLVDYVDLSEIVQEISAKGDRNLPSIPTNLLCGSKLLIAN